MTTRLPMFPLNTVLFPGAVLPLHVFEPRYRALVQSLLEQTDPSRRLFGTVAIREGYEVGDHGAQSLYRVGCLLQLVEVEADDDGTFTIEVVARDRIRLDRLDGDGDFPVGEVVDLPTEDEDVDATQVEAALTAFDAYRRTISEIAEDPFEGSLPRDPTYLSWTLAAAAPLPLPDRQSLLEADSATERLALVTDLLRGEVRAMRVLPSLPATEVARTRWSPN
ncbi:MAG: LON peptidase substrate-binding domain-containing protein [Nocardioides sp.]|uniref:LON peptidase substrate-binding domain-containing protein n=1 Tax=Nocardioides sp. TaxID=35761 RepID=UPI0039E4BF4B